ncbi:hypothetical protein ACES2L_02230 [Bdellovibrio bacteriovorus]
MLLIKFLILCSSVGFSQIANYNSIILGDRAAGMGGAGTALVEDTSSSAFYNPATLAQSPGSAFSAAVGIYKKYDTQYGGESDYTKTPLKVSTGFFRSLPASTGNLIRKENLTFGLSIVVPEYETFKGDLNATDTNTTTLAFTDESLWVGAVVAKNISRTQSWGLTLYYTARNFVRSVQDRTYPNTSEAILFTSEETLVENAIVPVLGYFEQTGMGNFGVSLRIRAFPISTQATYFESLTTTNPYSSVQINENNLASTIFIPTKLSLGYSRTFFTDLLLSTNVDVYEGFKYESLNLGGNKGSAITREVVGNISVGIEKPIVDWFKVRAGLFTNFSPYPDPDPNLHQFQGERLDQLGFSANAVFIADNKIGYTFGGYYIGGRGKAIERVNQNFSVITKSQHVFTMLAGTQFYF